MAVPHRLERRLKETLGHEAGDGLVDWMNRSDGRQDGLREQLAAFREEMRAGFAELRREMQIGFTRIDARFASVDAKCAAVDVKFASVDTRFAESEAAASRRHEEFMRWTVGVWVISLATMFGAVIALTRLG